MSGAGGAAETHVAQDRPENRVSDDLASPGLLEQLHDVLGDLIARCLPQTTVFDDLGDLVAMFR